MFDGDYLEQILGEKYNLKNFYEENEKIIDDPIIEHKETVKETKAKEIIPEIKPLELAINENDIKKESIIKEADIKKVQNEDLKFFDKIINLYPEIYRIINPMIDVVIDKNKDKNLGIELLEMMAKEIYEAFTIDVNTEDKVSEPNNVLIDLIKILILDKIKLGRKKRKKQEKKK